MEDAAEDLTAVVAARDDQDTIDVVSERFGTFAVSADSVLHFPQGPIGFPADRRFVILEHRPGSPFKWLLSLDDPELGFAIANPAELVSGYEPPLALAAQVLEVEEPDIALFVIVTIPSDPRAMTVNLMAPVVVDMRTRRARQLIVEGAKLDPRYPVLELSAEQETER